MSLTIKKNPLKPSVNLTTLKVWLKSFEHQRKPDHEWVNKFKYTGPLMVKCPKCNADLSIPDHVRSFTCGLNGCDQELIIE